MVFRCVYCDLRSLRRRGFLSPETRGHNSGGALLAPYGHAEEAGELLDKGPVTLRDSVSPFPQVLLEGFTILPRRTVEPAYRIPARRLLLEQTQQNEGHGPVHLAVAALLLKTLTVLAVKAHEPFLMDFGYPCPLEDNIVRVLPERIAVIRPMRIGRLRLPAPGHGPQDEERGRLTKRLLEPEVPRIPLGAAAEQVEELVR